MVARGPAGLAARFSVDVLSSPPSGSMPSKMWPVYAVVAFPDVSLRRPCPGAYMGSKTLIL